MSESTEDRFLGGRVIVRQPEWGFRSGLDAVMLAAAIPAKSGDEVLELGVGTGAASLCLATRVPGCIVRGVELDGQVAAIAKENARANGFAKRVKIVRGNALLPVKALRREFEHVMCNPPFHDSNGMRSPDAVRDLAMRDQQNLMQWFRSGLRRTKSNGTLTAIVRADRLNEALAWMPEFGVTVFPLWPKAGVPAKRVILQSFPSSRAPLVLSAGLVLHRTDGRYTPKAEAILRDGASLALGRPRL